jgi:hypothetical protein
MPTAEASREDYDEDLAIIARIRQSMAHNADVMRLCVIAERALVRRDGSRRFDRTSYMRRYMMEYRARKKPESETP